MYDDERDALAAEYVLGTLSAEEREQAEALLAIDPGFAEIVRRVGAPARRTQCHGRSGRAAGGGLGENQDRDRGAGPLAPPWRKPVCWQP